jgi:biotin carboxylase
MKVVVVDGYSTGRFLVAELCRAGVECVHVRSQQTPPLAYQRAFDPSGFVRDLGWFPSNLDAARAIKDLDVNRVIAGSESGVILADLLNHELGLLGNNVAHLSARRDKDTMSAHIRQANLAAPQGFLASSAAEAVDWYYTRDAQPVVVKPQASTATDKVRICHTASEVIDAVVVQELLVGPEFSVNTASLEGRHKVAEIWQQRKVHSAIGAPLYDYQEPVHLADPVCQAIVPYVESVLSALGIVNGAGHSELVLTERGPVLIEVGARLGGGTVPEITERYTGMSQAKLWALSLTDPIAFDSYDPRHEVWPQHLRKVALLNAFPGTMQSLSWMDTLRALPTAVHVLPRATVHQHAPVTSDLSTSPGFVYLAADDHALLVDDYHRIRDLEREPFYII